MSISSQFDNSTCPRCAGCGTVQIKRGPLIVCGCPAGRLMAVVAPPRAPLDRQWLR
jgi:hypothetical protein